MAARRDSVALQVGHNGAMNPRTTDTELTIALRWIVVGTVLVALATMLGILVASGADPLDVDIWWNGVVGGFARALVPVSLLFDFAGGGWFATFVVPLGGALILVLLHRRWSAVYFLAASLFSVAVVQLLKSMFGRARPEEMIVVSDFGSFPSGHTANAATIATVAIILLPRLWVAMAGVLWVVLMAFGRTHVHAHWLTDTLGGALIGVGTGLVIAGVFALPVLRERERKRSLG